MTATTETRKRSREDDGGDPMPLSKRINNLHINNNSFNFHNNHDPSQHSHENGAINGEQMNYSNANGFAINQVQLQQNSSPDNYFHNSESNSNEENIEQFHNQDMLLQYSPELDQQQNPYYYNKNKLLFELHAERLRRTHN